MIVGRESSERSRYGGNVNVPKFGYEEHYGVRCQSTGHRTEEGTEKVKATH